MKLSYARRYRRRAASSRESAVSKRDSQLDQPFFSPAGQQSFFKPNLAISRKCAHCEAEEKSVKRQNDSKEEEKKVSKKSLDAELSRTGDRKEEDKKLQRAADQKEEEKKVSRMTEKKDEKEVQRAADEKKDEKQLQRATDEKKEEKEVQRVTDEKKEEKDIQRAADEKEKEKTVGRKEQAGSSQSASPVTDYVHSLNTKGQPLGKEAQAFFGDRMNYDFSHVRIHTDATAQQSAKDINAKAFTVDNHIVFNKNQFNPASDDGKKLLAHELAHVMQNDPGHTVRRKQAVPEEEKEESVSISGTSHNPKEKKVMGGCNLPDVHGQTDFATLPSAFKVQGAKTRKSTQCEECTDCVTATGTIVSTFKSKITVTLPPVPDGLTTCEAAAVRRFINGTLSNHEQDHVKAFRTYNGTVLTPYSFTGCKTDLAAHIQGIHDGLDAQRAADAIAKSDALDPFVVPIPCNCD